MRAFASLTTALALLLSLPGLEAHQAWAAAVKASSSSGRTAPVGVFLSGSGMNRGGPAVAGSLPAVGQTRMATGDIAAPVAPATVPARDSVSVPREGLAPRPGWRPRPGAQSSGADSVEASAVSARRLAAEALSSGTEALARASGDLPRRQVLDRIFSNAKPGASEGALPVPAPPDGNRFSGLSPPDGAGAGRGGDGVDAPEPASDGPRLPSNRETLSAAFFGLGVALLAIAALSFILTPLAMSGSAAFSGLGLASLGASKFLQRPRGASQPGPGPVPDLTGPAWVVRQLPTLARIISYGRKTLAAHERFENRVGAGSWSAFGQWLASGSRAALYLVPLALLGMFLGTCLASPVKIISQGLSGGAAAAGKAVLLPAMSWLMVGLSYLALTALIQAILLGGVFAGGRGLLKRFGLEEGAASWIAGAAALAAAVPIFLYLGYTLPLAMPMLGIQAVLLYAYARSRTLLVPLGANALLSLISIYSARMLALIRAPAESLDSMPGIPGFWGVLAVLGTGGALFAAAAAWRHWGERGWGFLKAAASREWRRLAVLGRWWRGPGREGAPKSPLPILFTGLAWGVVVYLASYLTYYAVHAAFPVHEAIPESLKRTLAMPFDVLVYVFLLGAAVEEWVFRQGLFAWLREKLSAAKAVGRYAFWTAALASAVVFSAIHYVDMSVPLQWLHIEVPGLTKTLMTTYSFSWAGFAGRVAAGLALAGLYSRSRTLMIPFAAHFASNLLEAVGLRWGLAWMLAAIAGLFAVKLLSERKKSRPTL